MSNEQNIVDIALEREKAELAAETSVDTPETIEEEVGYRVSISNFDGPLDLLVHLAKEAKIELKNIFISEITEQYLEYLKELDEIDLAVATEFVAIAATLIEMKSKMLLPRLDEFMPEPEVDDEGSALIRQLEEYARFKEAAAKMKGIENVNSFYRDPDESVGDYRYVLKQMNLDGLINALSRLITKVELKKQEVKPRQIKKDPFTVADKIKFISSIISERVEMTFEELFGEDCTKSEVITTFQALLELMKLQIISVEQLENYGNITLKYNAEAAKLHEEEMANTISEIIREELEYSSMSDYDMFDNSISSSEYNDDEEEGEFELSIPFEDEF